MFDDFTVSAAWETTFHCIIGLNELVVLVCLRVTVFFLTYFWFFRVFDVLWIFLILVFKNNLYYSVAWVVSGIFLLT